MPATTCFLHWNPNSPFIARVSRREGRHHKAEEAYMKQPTVHQTHAICDSLKARGVIVLAFSQDNVAGASYGETKLECSQLGYTLDRIIEAIMDGEIPIWETEASIKARQKREAINQGTWCGKCDSPTSECDCESLDTGLCCGCGKHPDDCNCWDFVDGCTCERPTGRDDG